MEIVTAPVPDHKSYLCNINSNSCRITTKSDGISGVYSTTVAQDAEKEGFLKVSSPIALRPM